MRLRSHARVARTRQLWRRQETPPVARPLDLLATNSVERTAPVIPIDDEDVWMAPT